MQETDAHRSSGETRIKRLRWIGLLLSIGFGISMWLPSFNPYDDSIMLGWECVAVFIPQTLDDISLSVLIPLLCNAFSVGFLASLLAGVRRLPLLWWLAIPSLLYPASLWYDFEGEGFLVGFYIWAALNVLIWIAYGRLPRLRRQRRPTTDRTGED